MEDQQNTPLQPDGTQPYVPPQPQSFETDAETIWAQLHDQQPATADNAVAQPQVPQPAQPAETYEATWQQPQQPQNYDATWQQPQAQTAGYDATWQQPQQPQAYDATWQQPQQPQAYDATWQQPQYDQQQYQQPASPYVQPGMDAGYAAPVAQKNGLAIGSLVCGILAILSSPTIVLGILLGIVAIILGVLARKKSRDGKATGGIVCGIIGALLAIILTVLGAVGLAMLGNMDEDELDTLIEDTIEAPSDGTSTDGGDSAGGLLEGGDSTEGGSDSDAGASAATSMVIADDSVLSMEVTSMEIDNVGDLLCHFKATNNSSESIVIYSSIDSWKLNGDSYECYCYTELAPGESIADDYFFMESVPMSSINEVDSVTGTLKVEQGEDGDVIEYGVSL